MREWVRYLLWTVAGPLIIVAILNIGLFAELWKLIWHHPIPVVAAQEITVDQITIPSIGVQAPIHVSQHDPTAPWDDIRRDLENGVSLAPGLAEPGENGTTFITGHSSDYSWRPGEYKTVFALLPTLSVGEEIVIDYKSHRYRYRITGSQVVSPTNTAAFKDRGGETLTLMTCYPPLTTTKRWLTYAELIR